MHIDYSNTSNTQFGAYNIIQLLSFEMKCDYLNNQVVVAQKSHLLYKAQTYLGIITDDHRLTKSCKKYYRNITFTI